MSLCVFISLEVDTYDGMAEKLRKRLPNIFQSGGIILYSRKVYESFSCSTFSSTLFTFFLILDILMGVKWHLTVVLIFSS